MHLSMLPVAAILLLSFDRTISRNTCSNNYAVIPSSEPTVCMSIDHYKSLFSQEGVPVSVKGEKGEKGLPGPTGPPGMNGTQGPTGPKGNEGTKGEAIQGQKGAMGPVGIKGEKGIQGLTGLQGIQGLKGLKGNKGDNGLPGPKGSKGATPTSEIEQLQNELSELKSRVPSKCLCSCILKQNSNAISGIYSILGPLPSQVSQVYCDMNTDGGGWTVFQRRQDGSVDFYRNWTDYKNGFGNINGEFWLGLDYIHWLLSLSKSGNELRVDLGDSQGNRVYAKYSNFSVGDASTKYVLGVSGYSGNATDALDYHNGMKFSTKDQDNDMTSSNCASTYNGAWWYTSCYESSLNGIYQNPNTQGIRWNHHYGSLKFSEMKFRSI